MKVLMLVALVLFSFQGVAFPEDLDEAMKTELGAEPDALGEAMNAPMGSEGEEVFETDWLAKSLRDGRAFQPMGGSGGKSCTIRTPALQLQILDLDTVGMNHVTIYGLGSGFAISGWNTDRLEVVQVKNGRKTDVRASIDLSTCNVCTRTPDMSKPSCR